MYELLKYGSVGLCALFVIYAIYLIATGKAKFQQKTK
jgi:hypothetical protein